jgi:two-component system phosphate regulon sensor histidine kinase PhoR
MQDGVVIVNDKGAIQSINPAAGKMFDVSTQAVIGEQLIRALQFYQVTELFQKTLDSGTQNTATIDIPQRSLFMQGIGSILQEPAGRSVLLLFQDTSRQRQLETMRKDFVSNVSHELRTPLASLRALSETLESGALEDPPAAKHFIELMEVEIAKLTQMVDEILELSRIESGRVQIKRAAEKPYEMIDATVSRMELQAKRSGVALTNECPTDLPDVWADSEQIEQVLVNLIHNAIKFTPPGGRIAVSAKAEPEAVVFSVSDTGVGIAKEDLPRIFERFYKSDRSRATKGTGLGLSIAKHVIENHEGRLWVESTPGQGSTFHFSLPLAAKRR